MLLVQVHSCVLTRSKHAAVAAGRRRQGSGSRGGGDRHQHIQLERFHDVVILFQDFFCPIFGPFLWSPCGIWPRFYIQLVYRAILPFTYTHILFRTKKVYFKAKVDMFLPLMIINFLMRTPQNTETLFLDLSLPMNI